MTDGRWLVVGLGNPGPRYAATRHNAGFLVVDVLADRLGAAFKSHRANADIVEARLIGQPVVLVKPRSFMNESGGPAVGVARFYKIPVDRMIVVHDELDLPFGGLRVKQGGGDGGHNGLRSLTKSFGGPDYVRIRFGIGRPPGRQDPADYVLKEWSATERKLLDLETDRAADAVEAVLAGGLTAAQNQFN